MSEGEVFSLVAFGMFLSFGIGMITPHGDPYSWSITLFTIVVFIYSGYIATKANRK